MSQTRLISVRKSEPNQIVVYNLDRKNRTEIPARENTGTVQLSDPSEPVRSSPGSWPPDSGDAYKSITDLRNFQSWRRSMQPEAMLDLQTIRHVEMPCFFFCEVDMLREVAQNCKKCRRQIREMSL